MNLKSEISENVLDINIKKLKRTYINGNNNFDKFKDIIDTKLTINPHTVMAPDIGTANKFEIIPIKFILLKLYAIIGNIAI